MKSNQNLYSQKIEEDRVVEVNHADCGLETSAKIHDSEIDITMSGNPPQNEEGNKRVAFLLAEVLTNRDGMKWIADENKPEGPENGMDWRIIDPSKQVRPIQITRVGKTERWQKVFSDGVEETLSISSAATEIEKAIERKIHMKDPDMILVLSVGQPGFGGFAKVISFFRKEFLPKILSEINFYEIWVVGYSHETTVQIWP